MCDFNFPRSTPGDMLLDAAELRTARFRGHAAEDCRPLPAQLSPVRAIFATELAMEITTLMLGRAHPRMLPVMANSCTMECRTYLLTCPLLQDSDVIATQANVTASGQHQHGGCSRYTPQTRGATCVRPASATAATGHSWTACWAEVGSRHWLVITTLRVYSVPGCMSGGCTGM